MTHVQSSGRQVLSRLEGRACPLCTAGELVQTTYKGNLAVVCDDCGTPRVQFW
ncbi:HVO_A0556 family zinc finger protein [Natronobeatus ordinarius]|uniref:HVO_A0556 family zinc finger protein n=1 Tax=Natronobeatus ordinarius TaxID=2963433 RepID=UPI0020CB8304|nr:HVO_A0556 family zinc finger protein [Natronobeatus ordinarius]